MEDKVKAKKSPVQLTTHEIGWFHTFVEWADWRNLPPKIVWRFLLRKLDERLGYKGMNYDY